MDPTLYETIVAYEEAEVVTLNVKDVLLELTDDYLTKRAELTPVQKSELAALRAKIITGLNHF